MDAKAKLAAFGLVGRLEKLGLNRGGDVFGGRICATRRFTRSAMLPRSIGV
jgi:hypothetical protein